ncbi:MAG TPA: (deoxy)nucleoside triphosphate pyrophosphohydrolase [Candidatus Acidoferrales bacterium]|nr:(deoxy)nucleoside triphosphate pyrophosphohydrolase [Candidatus Acidoferrales bacterium]
MLLMVVAALIEHNGKLLVCQRRRGSKFELMWEFPGGKTEPGEALEQALARELREELGVVARIGPEIYRARHKYPEMKDGIELVFFAVSLNPAEVKNLDFEQIAWREPGSLPDLNFLPADRELIEKLADGSLRLPRT